MVLSNLIFIDFFSGPEAARIAGHVQMFKKLLLLLERQNVRMPEEKPQAIRVKRDYAPEDEFFQTLFAEPQEHVQPANMPPNNITSSKIVSFLFSQIKNGTFFCHVILLKFLNGKDSGTLNDMLLDEMQLIPFTFKLLEIRPKYDIILLWLIHTHRMSNSYLGKIVLIE